MKTYPEAVADVIQFRSDEGERFDMSPEQWLEFANRTSFHAARARAKGMGKWAVIIHHALRNALIPVVTVVGLQFGTLLGGAVLTETTFAWPGLGRLLVSAITARDYPVIQGIVIVFAAMFVVVNLVTDLLYVAVDPRIRYG